MAMPPPEVFRSRRQSVRHSGTPFACVVRKVLNVTARTLPMRSERITSSANFTTGARRVQARRRHVGNGDDLHVVPAQVRGVVPLGGDEAESDDGALQHLSSEARAHSRISTRAEGGRSPTWRSAAPVSKRGADRSV